MIKTINKHGQEVYEGACLGSPFSYDLFYEPEYRFESDRQLAFHSNLGSITVLDRMTGFGWRDIESGFRDQDGVFWLASGNYDVTKSGVKTIGEAIDWIKNNANTCVALPPYKKQTESN